MGWSVFIEEPGPHQLTLPYGIIAGVAVEDRLVWTLAKKLKDAEIQFFGSRLDDLRSHLPIDKMLSVETIGLALASPEIPASQRLTLVRQFLNKTDKHVSPEANAAFGQTCMAYSMYVLGLLNDFDSKLFAILSPIEHVMVRYESQLRKDYAFLFERFAYFLRDQSPITIGTLVLNAKEHSQNFVPTDTIVDYFENTTKGRLRSRFIIPEPVMANRGLATITKAAALTSYVLSWGFRLPGMTRPRRLDLDVLVKHCNKMRMSFLTEGETKEWSIKFVNSLRAGFEISPPAGCD